MEEGITVQVKVRSAQTPQAATIYGMADSKTARVELHTPYAGIAPGQACVAYDGERMLGGGWIAAGELPR